MKEMGYRVARAHADKLRRYVVAAFFVCGATVIAQGTVAGLAAVVLALLSIALAAIAAGIERWLFFAEARHSPLSTTGPESA